MDLTDEQLIDRFRLSKDSGDFQVIVRRYQNRIFSTAYRILGSSDEAEEVVQDTFLKVHSGLDRFRRQASFAAWIFRIAHNLCCDVLRTRTRRRELFVMSFDPSSVQEDDMSGAQSGTLYQAADPALNPAQMLEKEEQDRVVLDSLTKLPDNQRTVLVLHDIEGFSYQEIAEIIDTSIGTVRSRLHYGRAKMREILEPYFNQRSMTTAGR